MNETRTRRGIFMIQPEKVYLLVFFFLSQFALIAQLTIFEEEIKCICDSNSPGEIVLMATGTAGPLSFHWLGPNNYESYVQSPKDILPTGVYIFQLQIERADGQKERMSGEILLLK